MGITLMNLLPPPVVAPLGGAGNGKTGPEDGFGNVLSLLSDSARGAASTKDQSGPAVVGATAERRSLAALLSALGGGKVDLQAKGLGLTQDERARLATNLARLREALGQDATSVLAELLAASQVAGLNGAKPEVLTGLLTAGPRGSISTDALAANLRLLGQAVQAIAAADGGLSLRQALRDAAASDVFAQRLEALLSSGQAALVEDTGPPGGGSVLGQESRDGPPAGGNASAAAGSNGRVLTPATTAGSPADGAAQEAGTQKSEPNIAVLAGLVETLARAQRAEASPLGGGSRPPAPTGPQANVPATGAQAAAGVLEKLGQTGAGPAGSGDASASLAAEARAIEASLAAMTSGAVGRSRGGANQDASSSSGQVLDQRSAGAPGTAEMPWPPGTVRPTRGQANLLEELARMAPRGPAASPAPSLGPGAVVHALAGGSGKAATQGAQAEPGPLPAVALAMGEADVSRQEPGGRAAGSNGHQGSGATSTGTTSVATLAGPSMAAPSMPFVAGPLDQAGLAAAAPAPGALEQAIVDQVVRSATVALSNGQQEFRVQLKPDFLGALEVRVSVDGGVAVVRLSAESAATRQLIDANIGQLRQAFGTSEVRVEHVPSFDSSNAPRSFDAGSQSGSGAWQGHNPFAQSSHLPEALPFSGQPEDEPGWVGQPVQAGVASESVAAPLAPPTAGGIDLEA